LIYPSIKKDVINKNYFHKKWNLLDEPICKKSNQFFKDFDNIKIFLINGIGIKKLII